MAKLNEEFKDACTREPAKKQHIVITLKPDSYILDAADIGLDSGEQIGDLGIIKADLSGKDILILAQRNEIQDISPDFQVDIF